MSCKVLHVRKQNDSQDSCLRFAAGAEHQHPVPTAHATDTYMHACMSHLDDGRARGSYLCPSYTVHHVLWNCVFRVPGPSHAHTLGRDFWNFWNRCFQWRWPAKAQIQVMPYTENEWFLADAQNYFDNAGPSPACAGPVWRKSDSRLVPSGPCPRPGPTLCLRPHCSSSSSSGGGGGGGGYNNHRLPSQ